MAYEQDDISGFESVLKRAVRNQRQASTGEAACAGFDPELASAYLERSLGESSMVRFEDHLASCSSCRTDLTALWRLAPQPAAAASRRALRPQGLAQVLYARLRAFFGGLDGFTLPRPVIWAGSALAVASLVVGVRVSLNSQLSQPAGPAGPAARPAARIASGVASPSPQKAPDNAEALQSKDAALDALSASGVTPSPSAAPGNMQQPPKPREVPKPSLQPMVAGATVQNGAIFGTVSDPQGSAVARSLVTLADVNAKQNRVTVTDEKGNFRFDRLGAGDYVVTAGGKVFNHVRLPGGATIDSPASPGTEVTFKLEPKAAAASAAAAGSAGRDPAPAKGSERSAGAEIAGNSADRQRSPAVVLIDKTQEDVASAVVPAPLRNRLMPPSPSSTSKTARMKPHEVESIQSLTRRIRDKTFRFKRGVWIDASYDPDEKLPVIDLTSESPEFDTVLTREPGLKPFFDLGPVTLVWHGIVYNVKRAQQ